FVFFLLFYCFLFFVFFFFFFKAEVGLGVAKEFGGLGVVYKRKSPRPAPISFSNAVLAILERPAD
ncbi:hypothetical protein, partial [Bradyrhizobium canariense]|uniref:hypothetical protein n=1 Tax=Bradyrhizobium canariense TaxID=255045 RepID=UPI001AECE586